MHCIVHSAQCPSNALDPISILETGKKGATLQMKEKFSLDNKETCLLLLNIRILIDFITVRPYRNFHEGQSWSESRHVRVSVCLFVCLCAPSGAVFF